MQSIIYRRIKYILYIADKPWWVLHMYSMYVNFYVQSFYKYKKHFSIFLCIYLYILYIYLYRDFLYTPHQHLYYNIEKKKENHLHICQSIFSFYITNVFFIKIYLCTKKVVFFFYFCLTYSLRDTFLSVVALFKFMFVQFFTTNYLRVQQDTDSLHVAVFFVLFC